MLIWDRVDGEVSLKELWKGSEPWANHRHSYQGDSSHSNVIAIVITPVVTPNSFKISVNGARNYVIYDPSIYDLRPLASYLPTYVRYRIGTPLDFEGIETAHIISFLGSH